MPDPTVRQMLVAKIDELVDMVERDLDEIRAVTEQLEPDRAPLVPQRHRPSGRRARRDQVGGPRPPLESDDQ